LVKERRHETEGRGKDWALPFLLAFVLLAGFLILTGWTGWWWGEWVPRF
jgi:hypothetical protein